MENARRLAATKRGVAPFKLVVDEQTRVYCSAGTQTESRKASVGELWATGEVVRRFACNAYFALKAYSFLVSARK